MKRYQEKEIRALLDTLARKGGTARIAFHQSEVGVYAASEVLRDAQTLSLIRHTENGIYSLTQRGRAVQAGTAPLASSVGRMGEKRRDAVLDVAYAIVM